MWCNLDKYVLSKLLFIIFHCLTGLASDFTLAALVSSALINKQQTVRRNWKNTPGELWTQTQLTLTFSCSGFIKHIVQYVCVCCAAPLCLNCLWLLMSVIWCIYKCGSLVKLHIRQHFILEQSVLLAASCPGSPVSRGVLSACLSVPGSTVVCPPPSPSLLWLSLSRGQQRPPHPGDTLCPLHLHQEPCGFSSLK